MSRQNPATIYTDDQFDVLCDECNATISTNTGDRDLAAILAEVDAHYAQFHPEFLTRTQ